MSKEAVKLNLDGVTPVLPYRDYYRGRNGLVAQNIAAYLGLPYLDEKENGYNGDQICHVPATTITDVKAQELGIRDCEGLYGAVVGDMGLVGKAILHKSVSPLVPAFYSASFAEGVSGLVVPGFTAFDKGDIEPEASRYLRSGMNVRIKLSDKSDGHGQYPVFDQKDLLETIEGLDAKETAEKGVVVEADVKGARTISVGFCRLGSDVFSFVAQQKNDIAPDDGRNRYMGAYVGVVRGGLDRLEQSAESDEEQRVVRQVKRFAQLYEDLVPLGSRLSFDYLLGVDSLGNRVEGVSDITGRLGGTCPALSLAVLEFKRRLDVRMVKAEVSLNYRPEGELDGERGAVRFIDLESLRLTARIIGAR